MSAVSLLPHHIDSSEMATRSLTNLYKEYRAKAEGSDDHIVPLDGTSDTKLSNGEEEEDEASKWKKASKLPPEWLSRLRPVTEAMGYIKTKSAYLYTNIYY